MVRIVSLSVLLTLIVILGLTFFKVLAPFILPLFLAAVFAILCQPIYDYFLDRTKNRVRISAGLTTVSVVAIILVPLILGTVLASLQLFVVATDLSQRNLGRTLREKTEPVFQYAADFINARTQPQSIRERTEENTTDADTSEPRGESVDDNGHVTPATETPSTETTAESDSPAESVAEAVENNAMSTDSASSPGDDSTVDDRRAEESTLTPASTLPAPARGPLPPLTADSLRQQLQVWIRDSLAGMGYKSLGLGVAGGTFDFLSGSVVAVGSAALAFVIFAVSLYYFLADGSQLIVATERLIPVHVEYQRQMLNQFSRVVRAVVMATFFAALAQSIATMAALWLLGFDHLFIIFVAALLMSMIPMMGTWLVWLPCAGYLMYNGHWIQATLLCIYGALFVGMLDNVVRTYILNTDVKLHPLLALISVLGGLQVMGLWGMFVGPIVASCLHALVQIFNRELAALSQEKFSGLEGLAAEPATDGAPPLVTPTPPVPTVAKSTPSGQNGATNAGEKDSPASDV